MFRICTATELAILKRNMDSILTLEIALAEKAVDESKIPFKDILRRLKHFTQIRYSIVPDDDCSPTATCHFTTPNGKHYTMRIKACADNRDIQTKKERLRILIKQILNEWEQVNE